MKWKQQARSVSLNGAALGGLAMFGYGLWSWAQPAFWIVGGFMVLALSVYLCLVMKE